MKTINWKKILPHIIAVVVFALVAIIYCKPALQGKVLQQSDITQWKCMAQNSFQFNEKHGHFPLWTNGMFSGMPAYQIALGGDIFFSIFNLQHVITLFLPKPICFFFLACICFYFLSQALKSNPYIGIITSLAYAYATYNPVIISVGHDTKMFAIAYLPAFIGSLILIYERKYLWGLALTALFTMFFIASNHMQITYYGIIIAFIMTAGYVIQWIKEKQFTHLAKALGLAVVAGLIGASFNLINLAVTSEYASASIRGGSALADTKTKLTTSGKATATGLGKDYAFSYSMYKSEPLVMMFPRMYGGSDGMEVAEDKSKAIEALQQMPPQLGQQIQNYLHFYWGGIGGTSGPPYVGAIICFLALIGFAIADKKHKWWILACCALTIMMSWGQFFEGFNLWLLDHLPSYNKFRAPSMIIVVPTFLLCMMAVISLQAIITETDKELLWKKYKKGLIITASVFALALLIYMNSDFAGEADKGLLSQINQIKDAQQKASIEQPVRAFVSALKEDRRGLFMGDIWRSFLFILIPAGLIFFYIKKKLNYLYLVIATGVLAFADVITVDVKYLNEDKFVEADEYKGNFKATPTDEAILKDTSYYRVLDVSKGIQASFNYGSLPSYFHKNVGGYHPAKLSLYQDLVENQLYKFPNCMPVINMLNTKYIIQGNAATDILPNPNNLGACWLVKGISYKKGPAAVMEALSSFNPKDTAIIDEANKSLVTANPVYDSTASIQLIQNLNDEVTYKSASTTNQFAVLSEVYYKAGWKAYIDGKETTIIPVNYVLRGINLPAGSHQIKFEFKPDSYYKSFFVANIGSALIWILLAAAFFVEFRKKNELA